MPGSISGSASGSTPVRRKAFWLTLKLLVAAVGVWLIVTTVNWQDTTVVLEDGTERTEPGALRLIREADGRKLLFAWLWVTPMILVQSVRWWLLLRCRGVPVCYPAAFRLTWAGQFFNVCLPGSTGGDLVRAASAARSEANRATAVLSLVVDRLAGLMALILLGSIAGLWMWSDPDAGGVAKSIVVFGGGVLVAVLLYFSQTVRRILRVERWIGLLPRPVGNVVSKVDEALYGYRAHWPVVLAAIGLSLCLHVCFVMGFAQAGYAMGMTTPLGRLFVVMPIVMATMALPITYQGLGVADKLAVTLLVASEASGVTSGGVSGGVGANQVVGMLMAVRLINVSFGLLGSLALVGGQLRLAQAEPVPARVETDDATV